MKRSELSKIMPKSPFGWPGYVFKKEILGVSKDAKRCKPSDVRLDFPRLPDGGKVERNKNH